MVCYAELDLTDILKFKAVKIPMSRGKGFK